MKKGIGSLILAMFFIFMTNVAIAQCGGTKTVGANGNCHSETCKIALVKFSSDNCNASKSLDTKITELKGKFNEEVAFVKFDFTNDEAKAKTRILANEQGLNSVLESNNGTGYLVVYDVKNKKVLATLDNTLNAADMEKTIKTYL